MGDRRDSRIHSRTSWRNRRTHVGFSLRRSTTSMPSTCLNLSFSPTSLRTSRTCDAARKSAAVAARERGQWRRLGARGKPLGRGLASSAAANDPPRRCRASSSSSTRNAFTSPKWAIACVTGPPAERALPALSTWSAIAPSRRRVDAQGGVDRQHLPRLGWRVAVHAPTSCRAAGPVLCRMSS